MQFTLAAAFAIVAAALVGAAPQPRQNCPEASRFGGFDVSPTTVAPGQLVTVNANFDCAINTFGIRPEFIDFYINGNGQEAPILLARGVTLQTGSNNASVSVTVPTAYYSANASYGVIMDITYPVNGPNGMPYYTVGGVEGGIFITV